MQARASRVVPTSGIGRGIAVGLLVVSLGISAQSPDTLSAKETAAADTEKTEQLLNTGRAPVPVPDALLKTAQTDPDAAFLLSKILLDRWQKATENPGDVQKTGTRAAPITEAYSADAVLQQARYWLTAAAKSGQGEAAYELGVLASKAGNDKATLDWYRLAAEHHFPKAVLALGNAFLYGELGLARDCKAAENYFEQAEKLGEYRAFNNHAWLLATAKDKACRNPEKAMRLWSDVEWEKVPKDPLTQSLFADTVAAILAALSDYGSAIEAQQNAITLLKEFSEGNTSHSKDRKDMQLRLQRYQQLRPWFESDFSTTRPVTPSKQ